MSIPVLLSTYTGKYHFATDDGKPMCYSKLDPRDKWIRGSVQSIVDDVLCPVCVEARKLIPSLRGEPPAPTGQYIYIIQQAGSHNHKIGIAVDPDKRFNQIQSTNPNPLQLIWRSEFLESSLAREIERRIHQDYRHVRCGQPGQREWFNLGYYEVKQIQASIIAMIDAVC